MVQRRNEVAARRVLTAALLAAGCLSAARTARGQATPPASPAGETRCAIMSNGRPIRDVPCPGALARPAGRGPGIPLSPRAGRPANTPPPPPDPAVAEIAQGDSFLSSGNLNAALWHYRQALAAHPGDAGILNRIRGVEDALNALAAEAARKRDAQAKADYDASTREMAARFGEILSDAARSSFDGNAQSAVLAETIPDAGLDFSPPSHPVVQQPAVSTGDLGFSNPDPAPAPPSLERHVYFPLFREPVAASSPPAAVLIKNQSDVEKLDEKIERAQEALRRLMEVNKASEEQRLEFEKESEEATNDAEALSIKLFLDLAGGFNDELGTIRDKEEQEVLQKIASRTEEQAGEEGGHTVMAMLADRKEQLERRAEKLRLTGKLQDLSGKIEDIDKPVDEKAQYAVWISNWQAVWDAVSQSKKVEELTGPWADILDASYTMYRQADSLDHLAQIEGNNEKTLAAQASLRRLIKKLVLQKQAARARAAIQASQPGAEARR